MSSIIQTANSSLVLHDMDEKMIELVRQCIKEVDSLLDFEPEIVVFGRVCRQHRNVGFFSTSSEGYKYSSRITTAKIPPQCLQDLLTTVNQMFNSEYNGILVNKYKSGEDSIGKHSDDEKGLDTNTGVMAISYGAVRKFRIRNKSDGKIVCDVQTDPKKIIQMKGDFQKEFTHEIPVEKKVKGERFSFTFRKHTK